MRTRIGWNMVTTIGIAGLLGAASLARAQGGTASSDESKQQPAGATSTDASKQPGATSADTGASSTATGGTATSAPSNKGGGNAVTGKITSVDKKSNTVTLDNGDKLKLSDKTQVTKAGSKATPGDLHEGDDVRASYSTPPASNTFDIMTIEVMPAGSSGSMGGTGTSGQPGSTGTTGGAAPSDTKTK